MSIHPNMEFRNQEQDVLAAHVALVIEEASSELCPSLLRPGFAIRRRLLLFSLSTPDWYSLGYSVGKPKDDCGVAFYPFGLRNFILGAIAPLFWFCFIACYVQ